MIKTVHGNSDRFIERIRNKKFLFVLVIAATEVINHQGISAAGASQEMLPYTAALDSEYIELGEVKSLGSLPVSPAKIVSPAIISKACLNLTNSKHMIIDAGAMVKPKIPFEDFSEGLAASKFMAANSGLMNLQLGNVPSRSTETGMALSLAETALMFQHGQKIAQIINNAKQNDDFDYLVIGECVVGGTTTALGLLQALNYDCLGMVSSSIPEGNHGLKAKLIKEGYSNALLRDDYDPSLVKQNPLLAVSAMGDPMQAVVAGIVSTVTQQDTPVMLAGGSQMLAVASLVESLFEAGVDNDLIIEQLCGKDKPCLSELLAVATTPWVVRDKSAQTVRLAEHVCKQVPLIYPDFDASKNEILASYEQGHVKEGVGAGALISAAHLSQGFEANHIFDEVDGLYSKSLVAA